MFKSNSFLIFRNFSINNIRNYASLQAGQPLHETRPNLLKSGELTPGITALEYFDRRVKFAKLLPAKSCAIIAGNQVKYASGAVFYDFQQNNNLFYLSGWNEPDSVLILEKQTENLIDLVFHMLVRPKDEYSEKWEGFRTGIEGVRDIFNADESDDISNLSDYVKKIVKRCDNIFYDKDTENQSRGDSAKFGNFFSVPSNSSQEKDLNAILQIHGTNKKISGLDKILAPMRRIKSPSELKVMRRAGQISAYAYNQALPKKFRNERTLQAYLEFKFISGGCDKSAYIPVVASGKNALCIHYTRNNDTIDDGKMVLVDAAGSIGGYRSDISRTWPINGKFTEAQKALYSAVLNVEKRSIELCTADHGLSLHEVHQKSTEYMLEELKNVGFNGIDYSEVDKLYPHYIGHNLGLDVHDVPNASRHNKLEAGQVITIEPGIYIPDEPSYPSYFRNIGIRIEDDIAVGEKSYVNLTAEAVKEIADIENAIQNNNPTKFDDDVIRPLDT
ncbi:hypothetical protein TPHA_0P00720 [Tetrapisispora phaffii CBS 4417]|uniref:Aminopeptidase P N-terminal domain-containing protein n=1 Tax=Tetrapisispora phaffii (strain ATCC 24235 / CBS 4417 / NBRC 1672 / NRRL Y-8282 / UCD 70-5) TaxID=1071381 RepID=G8C252_TETPH|nr:hypothetical protein TPHA_0P00720 [Tetrapisispora phaffii CBS 4417]CCE66230.1 hypothetical protein TPHA_0P00720 [Tetrapisispora phaffii CBS 4417]